MGSGMKTSCTIIPRQGLNGRKTGDVKKEGSMNFKSFNVFSLESTPHSNSVSDIHSFHFVM